MVFLKILMELIFAIIQPMLKTVKNSNTPGDRKDLQTAETGRSWVLNINRASLAQYQRVIITDFSIKLFKTIFLLISS